jgi:hypothetical protein
LTTTLIPQIRTKYIQNLLYLPWFKKLCLLPSSCFIIISAGFFLWLIPFEMSEIAASYQSLQDFDWSMRVSKSIVILKNIFYFSSIFL